MKIQDVDTFQTEIIAEIERKQIVINKLIRKIQKLEREQLILKESLYRVAYLNKKK